MVDKFWISAIQRRMTALPTSRGFTADPIAEPERWDNLNGSSLALVQPRSPVGTREPVPGSCELAFQESPDLSGQFSQIALASAEQPHVHRNRFLRQYLNKPLGLRERHRKKRKPEPATGGSKMVSHGVNPDNAAGTRRLREILQQMPLVGPNIAE